VYCFVVFCVNGPILLMDFQVPTPKKVHIFLFYNIRQCKVKDRPFVYFFLSEIQKFCMFNSWLQKY